MNIEILQADGAANSSPSKTLSKSSSTIASNEFGQPSRATDVTKVPTEGQADASVTPSLLGASGTWTTTEEVKEEVGKTQRRMLKMSIQRKIKAKRGVAAAQAANVDDAVDDPDSEAEKDTTERNLQDPNDQDESSHDVDSDGAPQETDAAPWIFRR